VLITCRLGRVGILMGDEGSESWCTGARPLMNVGNAFLEVKPPALITYWLGIVERLVCSGLY
jgi:hypothetical protein